MRPSIRALALIALLAFPSLSRADVPYKNCIDVRGHNVLWVADGSLRWIAQAGYADDDWPLVRYNPDALSSLRPQTRLFFQVHECAHHVFGHPVRGGMSLADEKLADCWAVNSLFHGGSFGPADVSLVQEEIGRLAEGDWTHVPGPRRKIDLKNCSR